MIHLCRGGFIVHVNKDGLANGPLFLYSLLSGCLAVLVKVNNHRAAKRVRVLLLLLVVAVTEKVMVAVAVVVVVTVVISES